jgi:hypothetical protein
MDLLQIPSSKKKEETGRRTTDSLVIDRAPLTACSRAW